MKAGNKKSKKRLKMNVIRKKNSVLVGGNTHYKFKPAEVNNID